MTPTHHLVMGPDLLTEIAKLLLVSTLMGEVGAHKPGVMPPGKEAKTIEYTLY